MIKIKQNFPEFNQTNNSQGNNGVKGGNAKNSRSESSEKPPQTKNKNNHELSTKNNLATVNLKTQIEGKLNINLGLLKNISTETNFFILPTYQFGSVGKSFTLKLSQNLQIAMLSIVDSLNPTAQNVLKGISSEAFVVNLLFNVGLKNEIQSNTGLPNIINNSTLDNPVLQRMFDFLSNNNPTIKPTEQIINLWNNINGIFADCACAKTTKDLQNIAIKYASILQTADFSTLATLNEIIKESKWQNPENAKLHILLGELIKEGKLISFKEARFAYLNQSKTANENAPKTNVINTQAKPEHSAKSNQLVGSANQILVSEKDRSDRKDFYSEKTENALRKQLDYYPHYAYDRQISSFENSEDANLGRQEFVDKYYSEIDDWLKSGKHRLVKDFEFDKPLGMIVERGESDFITADTLRVVLVRDGSVDGWHFLRSFLIN